MEEYNKIDSSEEKGSRRGRFMRTFRAVLFHIKLKRINREKRIGSDSMRSSLSFRFRKQNHDNNVSKSGLLKSASTRSTSPSISSSSSSSSSSRLSFPSSEPRTSVSSTINHQNPKPQKQSIFKEQSATSVEKQSSIKGQGQRQRSSTSIMIGLVLILMSLGLTILWGRVWAIAFNAVWLAYVRQKRSWRRELGSDDDEVERVVVMEVRRRVIMEGLLDRAQHHRQSWQQRKL